MYNLCLSTVKRLDAFSETTGHVNAPYRVEYHTEARFATWPISNHSRRRAHILKSEPNTSEASADVIYVQFPCGRVKRFLKNNTQNKMRVGAKGQYSILFFPRHQFTDMYLSS
jgi:hypothetical protein